MNIRSLPNTPPFIMAATNVLSPEQQYERSLLVQDLAAAETDDDRDRAAGVLERFDDRAGV